MGIARWVVEKRSKWLPVACSMFGSLCTSKEARQQAYQPWHQTAYYMSVPRALASINSNRSDVYRIGKDAPHLVT